MNIIYISDTFRSFIHIHSVGSVSDSLIEFTMPTVTLFASTRILFVLTLFFVLLPKFKRQCFGFIFFLQFHMKTCDDEALR